MADTREGRTLRLPPEMWARISEAAREQRRSTTKQIEMIIAERLATPTQPERRD